MRSYVSFCALVRLANDLHRQLDRIVALWQVLNPDTYVLPLPNTGGDFVKEPGTMEDVNTREHTI